MGSVIGACLGSCVATCACKGCEAVGGAMKDSRVPYLVILFVFSLVAGILRFYGEPLRLSYIVNIDVCVDSSKCYGVGAVYRLTFCAFVFFALNCLMLTSQACVKRGVDTGFWIIKILLLIGLLVMSFLLPSQVFDGFFWVAMVVSGVFIIAQIIILIDFAYSWNDDWLEKDWKKPILASAVGGYVLSLVALILMYVYFAKGPECGLEQAFTSITLILTLIFTGISTTRRCEHGAILPSAVCTVYCYWILYSALSANPNPQCNSTMGSSDGRTIVSFILAAASVAYAAFNASQNSHALSLKSKATASGASTDKDDKEAPIKYHDTEEAREDAEESLEETQELLAEQTRRAWHFQLMMASGACYACMLLTDWGEASPRSDLGGKTSVWIQMASQWLAALLYMWSLVAPYVLTNREF